jgi:hypothetical protein
VVRERARGREKHVRALVLWRRRGKVDKGGEERRGIRNTEGERGTGRQRRHEKEGASRRQQQLPADSYMPC